MVEKFAIVVLLRPETLRVQELHGAHWLFKHITMTSYGLLSETTGTMFCSLERQLYVPYQLYALLTGSAKQKNCWARCPTEIQVS